MSKSLLSVSKDIVDGIWGVGTETYKVVKNEVNNAIDNEADFRTEKILGDKLIDKSSLEYQSLFNKEREKVERDAKELAVKGGLLAVGLSFMF